MQWREVEALTFIHFGTQIHPREHQWPRLGLEIGPVLNLPNQFWSSSHTSFLGSLAQINGTLRSDWDQSGPAPGAPFLPCPRGFHKHPLAGEHLVMGKGWIRASGV